MWQSINRSAVKNSRYDRVMIAVRSLMTQRFELKWLAQMMERWETVCNWSKSTEFSWSPPLIIIDVKHFNWNGEKLNWLWRHPSAIVFVDLQLITATRDSLTQDLSRGRVVDTIFKYRRQRSCLVAEGIHINRKKVLNTSQDLKQVYKRISISDFTIQFCSTLRFDKEFLWKR